MKGLDGSGAGGPAQGPDGGTGTSTRSGRRHGTQHKGPKGLWGKHRKHKLEKHNKTQAVLYARESAVD